jgi:hypothetical protein
MTSLDLVNAVAEVRVGSSDNVVRVFPDPASSLGCRKDGLGGLAGSEASRFESLTGMLIGPLEILPTSMSTAHLAPFQASQRYYGLSDLYRIRPRQLLARQVRTQGPVGSMASDMPKTGPAQGSRFPTKRGRSCHHRHPF